MPTIEISDTDFHRLQSIAEPLVDTTKTVVSKIIDFYERNSPLDVSRTPSASPSDAIIFSAENVPPLTHTKLMAAQFSGISPDKTSWDSLVRLALVQVMEICESTQDLHRLSGANVVDGEKDTEGYKFLSEQNFSYQGVSAEDAAKITIRCARALNCKVQFEFVWHNKDAAHRPGGRGVVRV